MPATGNVGDRRGRQADRLLNQPFIALLGPRWQPRVEHNRHIAAPAALVLPDDRTRQLSGRSPVNPAQAVAALPWTQAVVIAFAHASLRVPSLVADLFRLQQARPRRKQPAQ